MWQRDMWWPPGPEGRGHLLPPRLALAEMRDVDGAGFYRDRWPVRSVALIGNMFGALGSVKQRRDMIRPAS